MFTGSLVVRVQFPFGNALYQATNNQNWGCPNSLLYDIARASHDYDDYHEIMRHVWAGLQEKGPKWRRVFKTLTLLEFLIKNGSERVIDEMREGQYKVRLLMVNLSNQTCGDRIARFPVHEGVERSTWVRFCIWSNQTR